MVTNLRWTKANCERAVPAANLCLDGACRAAGLQPGAEAFCLDAQRPERTRVISSTVKRERASNGGIQTAINYLTALPFPLEPKLKAAPNNFRTRIARKAGSSGNRCSPRPRGSRLLKVLRSFTITLVMQCVRIASITCSSKSAQGTSYRLDARGERECRIGVPIRCQRHVVEHLAKRARQISPHGCRRSPRMSDPFKAGRRCRRLRGFAVGSLGR